MSQTATETDLKVKIKEPARYQVIYFNDEQTTAEFVTTSLIEFFNYSTPDAEHVTQSIHDNGSAVVAVLPYELAEQKGIEVTLEARKQGFPLQIKIEPRTE